MTLTDAVENFIRPHRDHSQLVGDTTAPTLTGYRVTGRPRFPASCLFRRRPVV